MAGKTDMPTRVGVLESSVGDLRSAVDNVRVETRQGFDAVNRQLADLGKQMLSSPKPTNWLGIVAAMASTVVIIGALFSLAEWRVGVAQDPTHRALEQSRKEADKQREMIIELRIQNAIIGDRLGRQNSAASVPVR